MHLSSAIEHVVMVVVAVLVIACIAWVTCRYCEHGTGARNESFANSSNPNGGTAQSPYRYPNNTNYYLPSMYPQPGQPIPYTTWIAPTKGQCNVDYGQESQTVMAGITNQSTGNQSLLHQGSSVSQPPVYLFRILWSPDDCSGGSGTATGTSISSLSGTFDLTVYYTHHSDGHKNTMNAFTMGGVPVTYTPPKPSASATTTKTTNTKNAKSANTKSANTKTSPASCATEIPICFPNRVHATQAIIQRVVLERTDSDPCVLGIERVFVMKHTGTSKSADTTDMTTSHSSSNRGALMTIGSWSVEPVSFVSPTTNADGLCVSLAGSEKRPCVASADGIIHYERSTLSTTQDYHTLRYVGTTRVHRMSITFAQIGEDEQSLGGGSDTDGTDVTLYFGHVVVNLDNAVELMKLMKFHEACTKGIRSLPTVNEASQPSTSSTSSSHPLLRTQMTSITLKNVKPSTPVSFEIALAQPYANPETVSFIMQCDTSVKIQQLSETPLYRPNTQASSQEPPASINFVQGTNKYTLPASTTLWEKNTGRELVTNAPIQPVVDVATMASPFGCVANLHATPNTDGAVTASTSGSTSGSASGSRSTSAPSPSSSPTVLTRTFPPPPANSPPSRGFVYSGAVFLPDTSGLLNHPTLECTIRFANATKVTLSIRQDKSIHLTVQSSTYGTANVVHQYPDNITNANDVEWYLSCYETTFQLDINKTEIASGQLSTQAAEQLYQRKRFGSQPKASTSSTHSYPPVTCVTLHTDPHARVRSRLYTHIHSRPSLHQRRTHHRESYYSIHSKAVVMYQNPRGHSLAYAMEHSNANPNTQVSLVRSSSSSSSEANGGGDPLEPPAYRSLRNRIHHHNGITVTAFFTHSLIEEAFAGTTRQDPRAVFNQYNSNQRTRYRVLMELDTIRIAMQQRLPRTDYFAYDIVASFLTDCGSFSNTPEVLASDTALQNHLVQLQYTAYGNSERVCLMKYELAQSPPKMIQSYPHTLSAPFANTRRSTNTPIYTYTKFDHHTLLRYTVSNRVSPTRCNPFDADSGCPCATTVTGSPYMGISNFQTTPSMEWVQSIPYADTQCVGTPVNPSERLSREECLDHMERRDYDEQYQPPEMVSYHEETGQCVVCPGEYPVLQKGKGVMTYSRHRRQYEWGV